MDFNNFLYLFVFALIRRADSKTRRFNLSQMLDGLNVDNADKNADYSGTIAADIVRTFFAICHARLSSNSIVAWDGESYRVSEYTLPRNWWLVATYRRIYYSASGANRGLSLWEVPVVAGRILPPQEVSYWLNLYNKHQGAGSTIVLEACPVAEFDRVITYFDLPFFFDADTNRLIEGNTGVKGDDGHVAQILGYKGLDVDPTALVTFAPYSEVVMSEWLTTMS